MARRFLIFLLMAAYLYTLTVDLFLTNHIKVPAPLLCVIPLLIFFPQRSIGLLYTRELCLITVALFLYCIIGMQDYPSFINYEIAIVACVLYFNFFVGQSKKRFLLSSLLFFLILFFSMVMMIADHYDQDKIDMLRSLMLDDMIKQSPSGLAVTQFTFGYQITAFVILALTAAITLGRNLILTMSCFIFCIICLYLGMNRSAFLSFAVSIIIFLVAYYRFKFVLVMGIIVALALVIYNSPIKDKLDSKNNILSKNQAREANEANRVDMALENLKIYADYPLGLIFYNKTWEDVTYRNPRFPFGLSSHNAYLMFFTYLGPFLGLGLLIAIYRRFPGIMIKIISNIQNKDFAVLSCLLFAFIGVSFNALSHTGWLLSSNGPTLFLFFAVLHGIKIYIPEPKTETNIARLKTSNSSLVKA